MVERRPAAAEPVEKVKPTGTAEPTTCDVQTELVRALKAAQSAARAGQGVLELEVSEALLLMARENLQVIEAWCKVVLGFFDCLRCLNQRFPSLASADLARLLCRAVNGELCPPSSPVGRPMDETTKKALHLWKAGHRTALAYSHLHPNFESLSKRDRKEWFEGLKATLRYHRKQKRRHQGITSIRLTVVEQGGERITLTIPSPK